MFIGFNGSENENKVYNREPKKMIIGWFLTKSFRELEFRLIKNPDAIRRQISIERVCVGVGISVSVGMSVHVGVGVNVGVSVSVGLSVSVSVAASQPHDSRTAVETSPIRA